MVDREELAVDIGKYLIEKMGLEIEPLAELPSYADEVTADYIIENYVNKEVDVNKVISVVTLHSEYVEKMHKIYDDPAALHMALINFIPVVTSKILELFGEKSCT